MPLNILVFLGSVRNSTPPSPERLGLRVAQACVAHLRASDINATLIDPLDIDLGPGFKPHFAYAHADVPPALAGLASQIKAADGYVMVSPEYNHSMSPALAHLLNHFGSSLFSYKPSVIATYSAGQWGGARAAVGMRTFLSELGCLPVSAMIHVPKAQEVFTQEGGYPDTVDAQVWHGYIGRAFAQLVWWATAARHQRALADGVSPPPAFRTAPSQRNAP